MSTNPGLYPGNPSLPREVRDKILSTFKHTLSLYQDGKVDDCVIGCDFILKMDPRFSPARRLLEKAKNPAADVDLIELEAVVATTPMRTQKPTAADAEKLLVRAVESFNARDFDACINVAEQVLIALPGNVHAADLIEKSRHKKQVQSGFEASRTRALALLEARRYPDAARELDRMRELDAEHPAVSLLERRIQQAEARPAAGELGGMMDFGEPGGSGTAEPVSSGPPAAGGSALDSLSLDSLSLDAPSTAVPPPADFAATRRGPLGAGREASEPGSPPDLWGSAETPEITLDSPAPPPARPPARTAAEDAEKGEREIAALLKQGDDAATRGDYEGAIEIWSRIFLIDINSVEAVTRIEKARQDMEAAAPKAAEPPAKGKTPSFAADVPEPSFEASPAPEHAPPSVGADDFESLSAEPEAEREKPARPEPKTPRRGGLRVNPGVAMIGGAFVLLVAIGAWLVLRPSKGSPPPAPASPAARPGGSLDKATALFQEGKIPETIAELRRIRP